MAHQRLISPEGAIPGLRIQDYCVVLGTIKPTSVGMSFSLT